ncbi:MAG: hypothetical protein OIN85_00835 [Candidatus Methanoperedens sp.]|nr:hypothetical protein [Candidatus Methanoperedens sp.]
MAKRKTKTKRSKKNPFVTYSEEEIKSTESTTFVLQAGSDFFETDGAFLFAEADAHHFYKNILGEVTRQIKEGTRSEKKNARRLLMNLRVMPFRVH